MNECDVLVVAATGRLDHLGLAGGEGLARHPARERAPPPLPHRRIAAAAQPAIFERWACWNRSTPSASRSPAPTSTPTSSQRPPPVPFLLRAGQESAVCLRVRRSNSTTSYFAQRRQGHQVLKRACDGVDSRTAATRSRPRWTAGPGSPLDCRFSSTLPAATRCSPEVQPQEEEHAARQRGDLRPLLTWDRRDGDYAGQHPRVLVRARWSG